MPILIDQPLEPGTSVDLCAVFFNAADDPVDMLAISRPVDGLSANLVAAAEVRVLAARRRLVSTGAGGGPAASWRVTLPRLTRDQVAWLDAHVGTIVCVRDHIGTKLFGTYLEAPRDIAVQYHDWISVSLSLEAVSYSEAV